MNEEVMNQLRKTELEILDYVVSICNEYKLTYYILYGTLLGAVRHKGFIPWDDDIDIGLPRRDYDKLCSILKEQCQNENSAYFFQSTRTDKSFKLPFSKVRKHGTVFLEKKKYANNGIYIDIFPLDAAKHWRGLQKPFSYLMYRLYGRSQTLVGNMCIALADRMSTFYKEDKCKYYVSYGSAYPVERDVMKKDWFAEGDFAEFEGKKYRVPKNFKAYLTQIYGDDYMQLPPVEKRVSHNPVLLKFEDE